MAISNDREFQQALQDLPSTLKRQVGAQFAAHVLPLANDQRLNMALDVGLDQNSSDQALAEAYRSARSVAVQTYTACGQDADWRAQAEHFVAEACAAALTPQSQQKDFVNPAWKAAMQARMAQSCAMIDSEVDDSESESQHQYRILEQALATG